MLIRRMSWLVGGLVLGMALLSLFFDVMGLIAYGLIVLGVWSSIAVVAVWAVAWLLQLVRAIRRRFRLGPPLAVTGMSILIGAVGILVTNVAVRPAVLSSTEPAHRQLAYAFDTDQGDRYALRFVGLNARDQERVTLVLALIEQGEVQTADDKFQAAMILQHGTEPAHYERAYQLARDAAEAGHAESEQLWKNAYDRWMLSTGRDQVYGTQTTVQMTLFGVSIEDK